MNIHAQENLVLNGSFEEYTDCPTGWTQDWSRVIGWENANGSSPDFYHICGLTSPSGTPIAGIPHNVHGSQLPLTGEAYMGLYGVQMGNQEWREYIQAELIEPVRPGTRYAVSFHVSLSENSRYAISTLGAYISETAPSGNDLLVLEAEPQILRDPLLYITDTADWVLVTDTFASRGRGGERFITIGNFFSDAQSDTLFFNSEPPLGNRHAYYYIDDVSVVALDSVPSDVGINEAEELSFTVYPNPATNVLRFSVGGSLPQAQGRPSNEITVKVLDAVGRLCGEQFPLFKGVSANSGRGISGEVNTSTLPPGIYFLELTDQKGQRAVRKFVKE